MAREATQQLLEAGHERIAYITSMELEGEYREAADFGLTPVAQRVGGMMAALPPPVVAMTPR